MEDTLSKVEELAGHVKEYVDNRMESLKLGAVEKSVRLLANMRARAIATIVIVLFFAFLSLALAFFLAKKTGELYLGFLIVAAIYLLISLLIWAARDKLLQEPLTNIMLRQLFKNHEDEKNN